jgi:hypothetical protein
VYKWLLTLSAVAGLACERQYVLHQWFIVTIMMQLQKICADIVADMLQPIRMDAAQLAALSAICITFAQQQARGPSEALHNICSDRAVTIS